MTSVYALIDEDLVSGDVHELDIWRQSLSVGTWQLVLGNKANKWGDDFHTNDVVVLKINGVELLRGYVDDVQPYLDPQGVYTNLIKVVGRDYGRDLARLYVTASYSDTKGDDVIDDLLEKAGSEILFTSPHLAPVINIARVRTYLIDWLQNVGKELNYDAYVSGGKTLNLFAVGAAAKHTAVDLKSIADAMTNNILKLLKGEEIGFSIANCVELSAGAVRDHYSDGNAADWDPGTNTTVVNEPMTVGSVVANTPTTTVFKTDLTIAIDNYYNGLAIEFTSGALDGQRKIISGYVGATKQITVQTAFSEAPSVDDVFVIEGCWVGISSIKFYCTINALPSMTLDFSGAGKYGHAGLDMSAPAEMSFYTRHKCVAATASVRPRLEDAGGNIIEFKRMGGVLGFIGDAQKGKTDLQVHNKWYKIQIPIGESEDNIIKSSEANGKWYYTTEIDEFDWGNVVKIIFTSAGATAGYGNFWIDNLCIPNVEVISIGEDATSIAAYDKAMFFDQRNDIKSQVELDALMESELAKRKDPLQKIHIIASGQTGSRYAGVSLDVQAPGHGIADLTKYRIFKLHHKVRKDPITKGFDFTTEYDLIKHTINPTQVVDPLRVSLADDPVGTLLNILSLTRRQVRTAETTARREFGDTHPVSKVFYSGSGVAFPADPEDGFAFRLTADIASTHLAGYYQYAEATTSWVRQIAVFQRATNPTYGQLAGDLNENTTDGMIYKWTGSEWLRITIKHTEGTTLPSSGMINGDTFYHTTLKRTYTYNGVSWEFTGTPDLEGILGDLDDVDDGATYNKILSAYTDTGKALVKVLGQIEDELITIGKVKDWTIGTTAPPSPSQGHIWLDTDESPPQMKRWDGSNWVRMDLIALVEMQGDLDDIDDGTNYGKILLTCIQAGKILLAEVVGDLDDIVEGTTYGKVKLTSIQAGEILLAETIGDLDDVANGTVYGKIKLTSIQSGQILLAQTIGDLDDVGNGTTYGKVLVTSISGGKILVGQLDGDLDDLGDGSTFAKMPKNWRKSEDVTLIDGGKIYTGTIVAGSLDVDFIIGNVEIKTGSGVQWAAGGNPGVIITDLGIRGKGAGGAIMTEMLASDGKITAAGGAIRLDDVGLNIITDAATQYIIFRKANETIKGAIYKDTNDYIVIHSTDGRIRMRGHTVPLADAGFNLGLDAIRWDNIYGDDLWGKHHMEISNLAGRPAAGAGVANTFYVTREADPNDKSILWVCLRNDADNWEWVQVGIST